MDDAVRILVAGVAVVFGAAVGSFLNVCVYRLPRDGMSPNRPRRSFCPRCGFWIPWRDNLPIVSWLALGGRCRRCRAPISVRYTIVEALTAVLFAVLALKFLAAESPQIGLFAVLVALVSALIVASFIDLELRLLPDRITIGGMMLSPFVALAVPEMHARPVDDTVAWLLVAARPGVEAANAALPSLSGVGIALVALLATALGAAGGLYGFAGYWRLAHRGVPKPLRDGALGAVLAGVASGTATVVLFRPELLLSPRVYSLCAAGAGMFAGASLVLGVGVFGRVVFRKPAMGFGDVKLMGLLGAFTGWFGVFIGFFLACFVGSIVGVAILIRRRDHYLPFGPFLAAGALFYILWPDLVARVLDWWL